MRPQAAPFPAPAGALWTELWRTLDRNLQLFLPQQLDSMSTDVDNPVPDVYSRPRPHGQSPCTQQLAKGPRPVSDGWKPFSKDVEQWLSCLLPLTRLLASGNRSS